MASSTSLEPAVTEGHDNQVHNAREISSTASVRAEQQLMALCHSKEGQRRQHQGSHGGTVTVPGSHPLGFSTPTGTLPHLRSPTGALPTGLSPSTVDYNREDPGEMCPVCNYGRQGGDRSPHRHGGNPLKTVGQDEAARQTIRAVHRPSEQSTDHQGISQTR